ncbi:MAG: BBP7 family outer membrane beta-barrel protein [Planctomycetales bacterium]|nr:BBP7 family outer membrane beta-barrel protein [Planctomycetales bacterium]
MLLKRFLASLAAIVALFAGTAVAQGPMSPVGATFPVEPPPGGAGDNLQFISDQLMNYDMQMFAPVDYNLLEDEQRPSTGLFFCYDRTANGITGPDVITTLGAGNGGFTYQTWGNRFDFGFMTEDDCGWTATVSTMGGGNFQSGRTDGNALPMVTYTQYQSWELNRVFRQRLKNGSYIEPYIGGRFAYLSDETMQHEIGLQLGLGDITNPDDQNRFIQQSQNNMFGGTLGVRWFRETGRWRVASNLATFLAYNSQFNFATDVQFDETNAVGPVFERSARTDGFVPMGETRIDISYDVTRDVSLRLGGQVMWYWEGLTRANMIDSRVNPNSVRSFTPFTSPIRTVNNQDLAIYGVTFGLEWRR